MFEKWGVLTYRKRKLVPVACILFILVLYLLIGKDLGHNLSQEGWEDPGAESTIAQDIENATFGRDSSGDVILLIQAPVGTTLDVEPVYTNVAQALEKFGADHPEHIEDITGYFDTRSQDLISQDHHTAFAAVSLKGDGEQTLKDFRAIKDDIPTTVADNITVRVAGATPVADALDSGMSDDIRRAELIGLPLVAILLLFVFGSVVAALMPLIVGIFSIMGAQSILAGIASVTQVNVFAQSIITLLGLGLAIDYGLFMVSRFREELSGGTASASGFGSATAPQNPATSVRRAVLATTVTAGKTVTVSAGMVAVALSGLFLFPQAFLKSIAYGAISAVLLAAFLSVTLLPALFALLGTKIDALPVRRMRTQADASAPQTPSATFPSLTETVWYRLPAWAMEHSKLVATGLIAVLMLLAIPMLGTKFGGINETYLPPDNAVRQAQDDFNQEFPRFRTDPVKLLVSNANPQQLATIYQQANAVPGLTDRFSPDHGTKDGVTVLSAGIADRDSAADVIEGLRNISVPEGVKVYIGGTPALEVESLEALFHRLPWMIGYIVLITFILMAVAFGSVVLPLKAVLMTLLGLAATLGIVTTIFVSGFLSGLLGFTPGPLMSPVLVLIIAIVYGLSTDYEVFLLSRMVEARDRGSSTDNAIRLGTAHTGSIITAAAAIMIVVCAAFGFSEIVMMKYIAFGMIAALLLDATVIRMLLVPAVMHLLAEDCWWAPGFIVSASRRLGDHVHLDSQQGSYTELSPEAYDLPHEAYNTPSESYNLPSAELPENLYPDSQQNIYANSQEDAYPDSRRDVYTDSQQDIYADSRQEPYPDSRQEEPYPDSRQDIYTEPEDAYDQPYTDPYEEDLEYYHEYQYSDEPDDYQLELPIDVGAPLQLSEEEIWEAEITPDYLSDQASGYQDDTPEEDYWDESADYAIPLWELGNTSDGNTSETVQGNSQNMPSVGVNSSADFSQQGSYSYGDQQDYQEDIDDVEYYPLPEYPGRQQLNRGTTVNNRFQPFKRATSTTRRRRRELSSRQPSSEPQPRRGAKHDTDTGSIRVQDIAQRLITESGEFPRADW